MKKVYEVTQSMVDRIAKSFRFIPKAKEDQVERYKSIRQEAMFFAEHLATLCPESRELSLALTYLEEAVMWANNAIARNEE